MVVAGSCLETSLLCFDVKISDFDCPAAFQPFFSGGGGFPPKSFLTHGQRLVRDAMLYLQEGDL